MKGFLSMFAGLGAKIKRKNDLHLIECSLEKYMDLNIKLFDESQGLDRGLIIDTALKTIPVLMGVSARLMTVDIYSIEESIVTINSSLKITIQGNLSDTSLENCVGNNDLKGFIGRLGTEDLKIVRNCLSNAIMIYISELNELAVEASNGVGVI